jgi:Protein of unknown function (DUF2939)
MSKKLALGGLAVLGTVYAASPYVALYRLGEALRAGDVDAVHDAVDWNSVRTGLKTSEPATRTTQVTTRDELPAFGASFVKGVVNHMVDKVVTPESMCASMQDDAAGVGRIGWAFFDGPRSFTAQIYESNGAAMRVHLTLEHGRWKVTRVDMPVEHHRT